MNRPAVLVAAIVLVVPTLGIVPTAPAQPTPGADPVDGFAALEDGPALDRDHPFASARTVLRDLLTDRTRDPGLVDLLEPLDVRRSPTGLHVRFVGGTGDRPIQGISAAVHYDRDDRPWLAHLDLPAERPPSWEADTPDDGAILDAARRRIDADVGRLRVVDGPAETWHVVHGDWVEAYRAVVEPVEADGPEAAGWSVLVHPEVPILDRATARWSQAQGVGRIFPVSPEVGAQDPDFPHAPNGSETPRFAEQTVNVTLRRLDDPGDGPYKLHGEFVTVDTDTNDSEADFRYLRSDRRFEDTMAYHHMDRAQALIQQLGFDDVNNESQLVTEPMEDLYNAFYSYDDEITFGYHANTSNGLADSAEDAEVVVHEYGHAAQLDVLPPDNWTSLERSAIAEGWADLFAVLVLLPLHDGYDPACKGDWFGSYLDDNRSDGEPYCFRRFDTNLTYPDILFTGGHYAGQVLSGFGWNVTQAIGRNATLKLFLEANFLMPLSGGDMRDFAEAVWRADDQLFDGAHNETVAWSARTRKVETEPMADFLGVEWVDHNPPRITRVSPEDAAQGRGVDLYGKDLAPNGTATVHVGNHTVEPDYINDGGWWVRFTVPDIPVGTYNLSIVRDGERLTYNGTFRVLPPLELDASVPTHVAPGESIVYEGEGFDVGNLTVSTHHFVSREERELPHEVLADDRLRVTVPANVTGPHQGLSIQRSDGAFLFDWHALLVNLPDLALSVVREPEPRRTLAPEPAGGADWVLEVRNVGTETLPADADDPVTLGAEAWGTDPPYGEWVGTWNLTEEIPPDGSRRFGIDIHPVCGCDEPWRQVPVGNWTGWAYLSGNRPPDLVWDNDLVRFEHRFLLPETPSLAPADALP